MKLYVFPVAPNPTRVRLYLAEKRAAGARIEIDEVSVDLREGQQRTPGHLARNPFGKLPVLELPDGSHLTESLAIIEYFEELHPRPPMIGEDPLARAKVRELQRIAEFGVLVHVARIVHATRSPLGLAPNPAVAEDSRAPLAKALAVLDARLADGRPFLAGPQPTVADCTLAAALQFGRFGGVALDDRHERIARWDRDYRERAPAKAVLVL